MRILFVEDNDRFARIVVNSFLKQYEVEIAVDVSTAFDILKTQEFDVVRVDYDLPDGKGDAVAKFAATLLPSPFIVAVSSHDAGNAALIEAGAKVSCSKMRFSGIARVLEESKL